MPSSTGISAVTGRPLTDWDHTQQSISKIFATMLGTRVMRRTFGSLLYDLVDSKMIKRNILLIYSTAAVALLEWEPRFRMKAGSVRSADVAGKIELVIYGTYYPLGHLGNYSVAEDKTTRIVFTI